MRLSRVGVLAAGLAASDYARPWELIRIPVVLMKETDGQKLGGLMATFESKGKAPAHDEL
jgi:hypothetical protein